MNATASPRADPSTSLRSGFPLASAVIAALATGWFYAAYLVDPRLTPVGRLFAFLPVGLSSYHRKDWRPGIAYTLFFASAFLWESAWATWNGEPYADLPGAVTSSFMLLAVSLLMQAVASARGSRETLADEARERGELLERSRNLDEVASFLCREAMTDLKAEEAGLLARNPVDDRWELYTPHGTVTQPGDEANSLRLANWLAQRRDRIVIDDLWTDGRFVRGGDVRSLLARPLSSAEDRFLGVLVLTHSQPGAFGPEHLASLDAFARAAETALAHAGGYERAGWAKERLAAQLAAIQRVARDLNASLKPGMIASRALDGAIVIAGASAGAILVEPESEREFYRTTTGSLDHPARDALHRASQLASAELEEQPGGGGLLRAAGSRLLIPIRRERRAFGGLLLESDPDMMFTLQDLQAMTALASHAAVALENARLFRAVEEEREKSQQIVQNMADGLLTLDGEWRVQSGNPSAERLMNQPASQLIGHALCELLDCGKGSCGPQCPTLEKALLGDEGSEATWRIRGHDEVETVLRLNAAPLLAPKPGAVVLMHDVTRDEALAQFQRELISTFSHELRSPLANISALTEVVLQDSANEEVRLSRELLGMLGLQARRLANLSQRTLDVARLDAGVWKLESRPLAVVSLARDAVRRWEGAAPDRAFALAALGDSLWAWGDEDAVGLILDNLLENAVKYAPPGTEVTVVVNRGSRAFVTLAVEDCGEPVPSGERTKLFERFYRRETTTARKTYGYGLGLYIVQKLSQAMRGEAWLEPADETGNRFMFSLPALEDYGEDTDRRG